MDAATNRSKGTMAQRALTNDVELDQERSERPYRCRLHYAIGYLKPCAEGTLERRALTVNDLLRFS